MTGMTNHAKKGEVEQFCTSVQSFSSSVCGLTEAAVQVGVNIQVIFEQHHKIISLWHM